MSLGTFYNLNESSVHIDILMRFAQDHNVWLVCKNEDQDTKLSEESGIHVLRVHTGALKGTGLVRKGINTVLVEPQFRNAIKKHLRDIEFDLILYTTPPITFAKAVKYLKMRDNSTTYLMLKDIFPQNAVDIGIMQTNGMKGKLYHYFRKKEKLLYELSDYIGCMSPANARYLLEHNPEIPHDTVEVCPNITIIEDKSVDQDTKRRIREKYEIPNDKRVFVYGGNLGKPQGIPFLIKCLKQSKEIKDAYFLIIGQGTEYHTIETFLTQDNPANIRLMKSLPKNDYETLVAACDIGMIFLDHRFTIPNFPSRLLSYMKAKVPVLAVTDPNTDIGEVIVEGGFGWWCESNDINAFLSRVQSILSLSDTDLLEMKENEFSYLVDHYNPDIAYQSIISKME